jgi:large subunit ribosomal protein L21
MAEKILKKAVIATGGKQYLVTEGQELEVEMLFAEKSISLDALLLINGSDVKVGTPVIDGIKVTADILEQVKGDKVVAIRYKSKKRVRKVRGHRQRLTRIKISKIG